MNARVKQRESSLARASALGIIVIGLFSSAKSSAEPDPIAGEPADFRVRPQLVARGDYYAPKFSPDGDKLLVTGERLHGLRELHLATRNVDLLSDAPAAGVDASYDTDGTVRFTARVAGATRHLIASAGALREIQPRKPLVFEVGDQIYLRTPEGVARISTGDRFFNPILSPDGCRVAYQGLSTGVHVFDCRTGRTTHLGAGTAPSWSPDGKSLVFERTEDDGHHLVASDILLWNAAGGLARFTASDSLIARRPSFSPDGKTIAFDDNFGAVYLLPLPAQAMEVAQ